MGGLASPRGHNPQSGVNLFTENVGRWRTPADTVTPVHQRKPRKRKVSVYVSEAGYDHMARRASKADVTVSHMHRRMLDFAARNMPANYIPPRETT